MALLINSSFLAPALRGDPLLVPLADDAFADFVFGVPSVDSVDLVVVVVGEYLGEAELVVPLVLRVGGVLVAALVVFAVVGVVGR